MVYNLNSHQCKVVEADKPLSSGLKVIEKCSIAKDFADPEVSMDFIVMQKALAMTQEMGSKEWLGYLKGFPTEDGFHVDDILVPKQTVSSADVDEIERVVDTDIVGTIHSHHNMGTFFSGTDHDYIGGNNPVMIVIDSKGNTKCAVRAKLQCGNYILLEAELTVLYADNPEIKEFIAANKDKITEKVYVWTSPYQNNVNFPYYQYQNGLNCNPQTTPVINARVRRWDQELQCWITEGNDQPKFNGNDGATLSSQPGEISALPEIPELWPFY